MALPVDVSQVMQGVCRELETEAQPGRQQEPLRKPRGHTATSVAGVGREAFRGLQKTTRLWPLGLT